MSVRWPQARRGSSNVQAVLTATPDPVRPGQFVQYAATVTNRGVNGVYYDVEAKVPNFTSVPVGAIGQSGFCVGVNATLPCPAGGTVRWQNFYIAGGQSLTLPFAALVDTASPPVNGTATRSTLTAVGSNGGATSGVDVAIGP